jgi:hypothetical protein
MNRVAVAINMFPGGTDALLISVYFCCSKLSKDALQLEEIIFSST